MATFPAMDSPSAPPQLADGGETPLSGQEAPPGSLAFDPASELRGRLLRHFDRYGRDLPWRRNKDPYRVWVSEVMLQQTRVDTVLPYYERWMEAFPDLGALADANEDQVLRLWDGLGYYSRARRLHGAARVVRDQHGGVLPSDPPSLRRLPGIGAYTAGALASIAFGVREPAVDGNARRVLARLFDLPHPATATLERLASSLLDPERPGDSNQALMELGATVCTPRSPGCASCPVERLCLARARGTVAERPARIRRKARRGSFALTVLADRHGRVLLVRREGTGLLERLWAFPESVLGADQDAEAEARMRAGALGMEVGEGHPLPALRHAFTHLRATYLPFLFQVEGTPRTPSAACWVDPADPGPLAALLSVARA